MKTLKLHLLIANVFSAAEQTITTCQSLFFSVFLPGYPQLPHSIRPLLAANRRPFISPISIVKSRDRPVGSTPSSLIDPGAVSVVPLLVVVEEMEAKAVMEVELILGYQFKNKKLLEEALTHSSYLGLVSYERLEFIGDSALGCALSNYFFLAYPNLDPGQLTRLRAANVSTEKLARVAIRHGLFKYVRHNSVPLEKKVLEFAIAIQDEEEDGGIYGGSINAPKILADIVESLAAAVYIDCNFDLQALWVVFRGLLEPIATFEDLQNRPQPVTSLFEQCHKKGKQVDIKHWRKGTKNIASVFIDGKFIASTSSTDKKKTAKLYAAKVALGKLDQLKKNAESCNDLEGPYEIRVAKQRLIEVCRKKKWSMPIFSTEKAFGPAHDLKFLCSVSIHTDMGTPSTLGDMKSKRKDAENSAASHLLQGLQDYL